MNLFYNSTMMKHKTEQKAIKTFYIMSPYATKFAGWAC